MKLSVIILAAGQGTRMHSALPKVLHSLAGKPLLMHVIDTARGLGDAVDIHVVYGHGGKVVKNRLKANAINWVKQSEQLGTGHAVAQALPAIPSENMVLVLYGDVPLTQLGTLKSLVDVANEQSLGLLTAHLDNPSGYGRIIRDKHGAVNCIVEEKDATELEKKVNEINTGMLVVAADLLSKWLPALSNKNSQGEYYLTDIVEMAVKDGININTVNPESSMEVCGVNNKSHLAMLERYKQRQQADLLLSRGVTLYDPARFDLRGEASIGRDVVIDVNVILEGNVSIGDDTYIGSNTIIKDSQIGSGVTVLSNCTIENSIVGDCSHIGPFARLRPETCLAEKTKIGNFVEIKKAKIGTGSKINHLSYVGDSTVGKDVNVGAGTITCNYDGANKHHTVIEDHVFIGSASQLVAPVTLGKGSTVGAGSTITRNVEANELTLSRTKQTTRSDWKRPTKNR